MAISQNGVHGERVQPRVVLLEHVSEHVIVPTLHQCTVAWIVKNLVILNKPDRVLINLIVQVS